MSFELKAFVLELLGSNYCQLSTERSVISTVWPKVISRDPQAESAHHAGSVINDASDHICCTGHCLTRLAEILPFALRSALPALWFLMTRGFVRSPNLEKGSNERILKAFSRDPSLETLIERP